MAKKKKEPYREIQHPPSKEYPQGMIELEYMDGSKEILDMQRNPFNKLKISDTQLEAWRKSPKEQALKEALELFKMQNIDVSETRAKLEILKFITELQGALVPVIHTQNVVAIKISVADLPPGMKIIEK